MSLTSGKLYEFSNKVSVRKLLLYSGVLLIILLCALFFSIEKIKHQQYSASNVEISNFSISRIPTTTQRNKLAAPTAKKNHAPGDISGLDFWQTVEGAVEQDRDSSEFESLFHALSANNPDILTAVILLESNPAFLSHLLENLSHLAIEDNANIFNSTASVLEKLTLNEELTDVIVRAFLSINNPHLADTTFLLLSEVDLDDHNFFTNLIQSVENEDSFQIQHRTLSLLQGLDIAGDHPYVDTLDSYLLQLSMSADEALRENAIIKRVWLTAESDRYDAMTAVINDFLLDHSPMVRETMYEVLEEEVIHSYNSPDSTTIDNIISLLSSSYFGGEEAERERVESILSALESKRIKYAQR